MAEDRKARLAALAARAGRTSNPDAEEPAATATDGADRPAVRFRNYAPKDAALEGGGGAGAEADAGITSKMDVDGDAGAPLTKRQRTENITGSSGSGGNKKGEKPMSALEEAMLQAKAEASALTGGVGGVGGDGAGGALASLAPQKVNADLKRDIKGKLDRLERRTQRALVDLLKERLEREAEEEDDGLD